MDVPSSLSLPVSPFFYYDLDSTSITEEQWQLNNFWFVDQDKNNRLCFEDAEYSRKMRN